MVWVPPPPTNDTDLQAKTLFLHRIPQRAEAFGAITKIFTSPSLPDKLVSTVVGINMVKVPDGAPLRGATAVFSSAEAAEAAFLALPAESIEVDKAGLQESACVSRS